MSILIFWSKVGLINLLAFLICDYLQANENEEISKGELIYQSSMQSPESVNGWKMEGSGTVDFKEGWMHMFSPKETMHHVYWSPKTFPSKFIAEWDAQNLDTDAGLCIVFFAAKGELGQDIFDPVLSKRNGRIKQYTGGDINSYHISYYANTVKNPDRGYTNLRKNNKFILVQKGKEGVPTYSKNIHKIRLIKNDSQILMFVDNRKIIDWTDDGKTYGPIYTTGKIGFRQMKWTHFRYRNFKVWEIKTKM